MRIVKKLYLAICRKVGPRGLTYSAWAWKHFDDTGNSWFRNRIDGLALFFAGDRDHCQRCYSIEFRQMAVDKNSEKSENSEARTMR